MQAQLVSSFHLYFLRRFSIKFWISCFPEIHENSLQIFCRCYAPSQQPFLFLALSSVIVLYVWNETLDPLLVTQKDPYSPSSRLPLLSLQGSIYWIFREQVWDAASFSSLTFFFFHAFMGILLRIFIHLIFFELANRFTVRGPLVQSFNVLLSEFWLRLAHCFPMSSFFTQTAFVWFIWRKPDKV